MRSLAIVALLVAASTAQAGTKLLADTNELAQVLGSKVTLRPGELDVAEVVAVRDQARGPTPMALGYAAAVEQGLAKGELEAGRGGRVLLALALALAPFGGPDAALLEEGFLPALQLTLGTKPDELKPRPQLGRELTEIGEWAAATVEALAQKAGPDGDDARYRMLMARGRWTNAAALARKHAAAASARWQARLGAALLLDGNEAEAQPLLQRAVWSGGVAERIARVARVKRAYLTAVERAARALKQAGRPVLTATSGGKTGALDQECRQLFAPEQQSKRGPAGGTESLPRSQAAVACATVLWETSDRSWLQRAAQLVPEGRAGSSVRALAALASVQAQTGEAREAAVGRFQAELAQLSTEPGPRDLLASLGEMAAGVDPSAWGPGDRSGRLAKMATEAPCSDEALPLFALALRNDHRVLARFVEAILRACPSAPTGAAVSFGAAALAVRLAHESPAELAPALADEVALALARAHEDDPEAIGTHADAVALKALSSAKPSAPALEAALARYEQAIERWTPEADPAVRLHLEANAGYLSLALARLTADAQPDAAARFLLRTAGHLRFALALGEVPAVTATRAAYDLDTGTGTTVTTLDLPRLPAGRSRARAACMLAAEAAQRGDQKVVDELLALARPTGSDAHTPSVRELLVDTTATLTARPDGDRLQPITTLRTSLYLAPPCDPAQVKVKSAAPSAPPRDGVAR